MDVHQRFQEHSLVSHDTSFKATMDKFGYHSEYHYQAKMHKLVLVLFGRLLQELRDCQTFQSGTSLMG